MAFLITKGIKAWTLNPHVSVCSSWLYAYGSDGPLELKKSFCLETNVFFFFLLHLIFICLCVSSFMIVRKLLQLLPSQIAPGTNPFHCTMLKQNDRIFKRKRIQAQKNTCRNVFQQLLSRLHKTNTHGTATKRVVLPLSSKRRNSDNHSTHLIPHEQ